jgi:predicted  nucleic acid-binding Zn-ribbon protein
MVNSLAYCSQAVLEEAKRMGDAGKPRAPKSTDSPFAIEELERYISGSAEKIRSTGHAAFAPVAESLEQIRKEIPALSSDLEDLERRLTALEEKLVAAARTLLADDVLVDLRRSLDSELSPFRGKMTADQISMLERRYLDTAVLEKSSLPRLSLFYLSS